MPGHDIITIGASAGGVETLITIVEALPADLPASVFIVLHVSPRGSSVLPKILTRHGRLPAHHARHGETIEPGRVYVAPPDKHLLIRPGRIFLSRGPNENGVRPSIDPLFRTAARWYGRRVVGVILSGSLDDGSAGLMAIKQRSGLTIVQSPEEALFPGMPRSALDIVEVDHCLPVAEIGPLLDSLARTAVEGEGDEPVPEDMEYESEVDEFNLGALEDDRHRPGVPSGFACPDCGGALWELRDGELVRFRCRVGHAWSPTNLLAQQSEALETALWTALRALEERAALAATLAERLEGLGNLRSAQRFREQSEAARHRAGVIRQVLLNNEPTAELETEDTDAAGQRGGQNRRLGGGQTGSSA
jgi:two-component system, chemotaxis family, protein-glutamate methylesterase/glutaminase